MLKHINFKSKDEIFEFIGEQKTKHCFIVFKSAEDTDGGNVSNCFILKDKKIILMSFGKEENTINGERELVEMIHICLVHNYIKADYCNINENLCLKEIVDLYDKEYGTNTSFILNSI